MGILNGTSRGFITHRKKTMRWLHGASYTGRSEPKATCLPDLKKSPARILWLTGENDPKFTRLALDTTPAIPEARHTILPGCGHRLPWESPELFLDAVEKHLPPSYLTPFPIAKILRDCLFFTLSHLFFWVPAPKDYSANPDFTKGGTIPKGATHDWNLGATGARGWMFSDKMETSSARQIAITKVAPGSPAEGVLQRGDVILGVNGKAFSYDPRTEFGKALTQAEADTGRFSLLRWRDGKSERVTITLPVLGAYCATAPFNCAKSATILKRGCAAIARKISSGESKRDNPIGTLTQRPSLARQRRQPILPPWLSRRPSGPPASRLIRWPPGITWLRSHAPLRIHHGDGRQTYFEGMRRVALEAARGQSMVGSWGHKFAGEDGRLFGYGMMNAPGLPLTSGLILARKAVEQRITMSPRPSRTAPDSYVSTSERVPFPMETTSLGIKRTKTTGSVAWPPSSSILKGNPKGLNSSPI